MIPMKWKLALTVLSIFILQSFHVDSLKVVLTVTIPLLCYSLGVIHYNNKLIIVSYFSIASSAIGMLLGNYLFGGGGWRINPTAGGLYKGTCAGLRVGTATALGLSFAVSTSLVETYSALPSKSLRRRVLQWFRLLQLLLNDLTYTALTLRILRFRATGLITILVTLQFHRFGENMVTLKALGVGFLARMIRLIGESQVTMARHSTNPAALLPSPVVTGVGMSVRFALTQQTPIRGVGFQISPGECIRVHGPDKSGKSTLLQAISGVVYERGGEISGRILLDDIEVTSETTELEYWWARVSYAAENPALSLLGLTVREELLLMAGGEEPIAESVALAMGLTGLLDRPTNELSGGEQGRLMLAGCMASRSKVLVIDDLSTYLDRPGRDQFNYFLSELQAKDPERVLVIADPNIGQDIVGTNVKDWDIYNGVINVRHEKEGNIESRSYGSSRTRGLSELRPEGRVIARLDNAQVWRQGRLILANCGMEIRAGELVAVVGPNGSGKTTAVLGLAGGLPVWPQSSRYTEPGLRIGYTFQDPRVQLVCETVSEQLELFARAAGLTDLELSAWVEGALTRAGLTAGVKTFDLHYSDAKLLLAVAVTAGFGLVIMDEPTAGVDGQTASKVLDCVDDILIGGSAVILVTHDDRLRLLVDRVVKMQHAGTVII